MQEQQVETATVCIVDDNVAVRDAIRWLVEEVGLCANTYRTAQEFLNDVASISYGCLVLDIRMPGMSGLDCQEYLSQHGITLPVIVVTGHGDVPMAVRSMKSGAFEFLQKPFNDQTLLDTIFAAIDRHQEINAVEKLRAEACSNLSKLTPRENEVLQLLRNGESSKTIAGQLHISVRTVEGHRANIMEKMDAHSVIQLLEKTLAAESIKIPD